MNQIICNVTKENIAEATNLGYTGIIIDEVNMKDINLDEYSDFNMITTLDLSTYQDIPDVDNGNLVILKNIDKINTNKLKELMEKFKYGYLDTSTITDVHINNYYAKLGQTIDCSFIGELKSVLDSNNINWLRDIADLPIKMKESNNIISMKNDEDILLMVILLAFNGNKLLIPDSHKNNCNIQDGIKYNKEMSNFEIIEPYISVPSIKTTSFIIRLNNSVVIENDTNGFLILNRGDEENSFDCIYMDWSTKLLGTYKQIGGNVHIKIVTHLRNKVILGLTSIGPKTGLYFVKVSDNVGEYEIPLPKETQIKKVKPAATSFSFEKGKFSSKYNEEGSIKVDEPLKPRPLPVFTEDDFPVLGKKKSKK